MYKFLLMAAVAVLSFSGAADAATYVITLDSGIVTSVASTSIVLNGDVDPNTAVLSPTSGVVTGSLAGHYLAPVGVDGEYLFVGGGDTASATFSLNDTNVFGLTWGSIDTYNALELVAGNDTYTISGTYLMSLLTPYIADLIPNGDQSGSNYGYQADVLFKVLNDTFTSAILTSPQAAFEVGTFTSTVPLPGALLLFASGLVGLGGVAARKKKA